MNYYQIYLKNKFNNNTVNVKSTVMIESKYITKVGV